jgi:ADP-ribosyl-[dinitrogen reductase] hydrolase
MSGNRVVSYGKQLEIAVDAARRAGDLLRKEFHRSGGPRGTGGHADVDEKAEAFVKTAKEAGEART